MFFSALHKSLSKLPHPEHMLTVCNMQYFIQMLSTAVNSKSSTGIVAAKYIQIKLRKWMM